MAVNGRWIWEWRCTLCGYLWQVIPSRKFPERERFQPRCPSCGDQPHREWTLVERKS